MGFKSDFVYCTITIRRDQKKWLDEQNALNFSGFVQQQIDELMHKKEITIKLKTKPIHIDT